VIFIAEELGNADVRGLGNELYSFHGQIDFPIELSDSSIDILLFQFPAASRFNAPGSVGVSGFSPAPDRTRGSVSKAVRETDWIGDQSVRVRSVSLGFTSSRKEMPRGSSVPVTERLDRSREFGNTGTQRATKEVIPSIPNLQTAIPTRKAASPGDLGD
jgi:hypothetical protein